MPVFMMRQIMPMDEYKDWLSYFFYKEAEVTEVQLAVLSTMVSNGLGGKGKVDDFLITDKMQKAALPKKKTSQGMGSEDVRAAFGGMFTKKMK